MFFISILLCNYIIIIIIIIFIIYIYKYEAGHFAYQCWNTIKLSPFKKETLTTLEGYTQNRDDINKIIKSKPKKHTNSDSLDSDSDSDNSCDSSDYHKKKGEENIIHI